MTDAARSTWLTPQEAAAMLGLSVDGLRSLVKRGRIVPDYRGGKGRLRSNRYKVETIERFLESGGGS